jgi:phosphoglycerate dehydrogenase-like enzyme
MPAESWHELPQLRVVCFMGTGWQSFIELPRDSSPTAFCYTPHANAEAVAEFALGLLIDSARQITARAADVRLGKWSESPTASLLGSTLGIIGLGHVGRFLGLMFQAAFHGPVRYWNRSARKENLALAFDRAESIVDLCKCADNVAVCLRHVPGETDGFIGLDALASIGPDGALVNVARAELVEPAALLSVLQSGRLGRAAIDGYYIEPTPPPAADPYGLLELPLDRLLVTPHSAYLGLSALTRMAEMATDNILAVAQGKPAPYPIEAGS